MSSVHNSVDTVNAAATAIVTAETRVQPTTVQKRRWGSCWSLYWCFGSYKQSKRIGHAILVPEPTAPGVAVPAAENSNHSTSIVLPFIAPPSSPASFIQSDPPSVTQSPIGLLSLSVSAYSPGGTAPIFTIGPYAHETQLVSPPVLSTFTTEPSTAAFTPPSEPVQHTTPSSPEVPFAQLLASSLARGRRNSGTNQKFSLSQYEFLPYQPYTGSPGGQLRSPGSAISNSGTSSPFPDKYPIPIQLRVGEAPKFLGYDYFTTRKWGSRLGSGSLTPNGWGSRLGSGSLTPNGRGSRLGSGTLTPNGGEPAVQDSFLPDSQISEVISLANSENGSQTQEILADHRVSFELTGEDVPSCLEKEPISTCGTTSESLQDVEPNDTSEKDGVLSKTESFAEYCVEETLNEIPGRTLEGEECNHKHRCITLGSSKDFDFDNTKGEVSDKSAIGTEWWTNEQTVRKDFGSGNSWSFFPMLQPEVS